MDEPLYTFTVEGKTYYLVTVDIISRLGISFVTDVRSLEMCVLNVMEQFLYE